MATLLTTVVCAAQAQITQLFAVDGDLQGPWYLVRIDNGMGWVDGGQQLLLRMHSTYFTDSAGKGRKDFRKIERAITDDGIPHEVVTFEDNGMIKWFISNAGRPHLSSSLQR